MRDALANDPVGQSAGRTYSPDRDGNVRGALFLDQLAALVVLPNIGRGSDVGAVYLLLGNSSGCALFLVGAFAAERPVICVDENPVPLISDTTPRLTPHGPGMLKDYDYERGGNANVFCAVAPKAGGLHQRDNGSRDGLEFSSSCLPGEACPALRISRKHCAGDGGPEEKNCRVEQRRE